MDFHTIHLSKIRRNTTVKKFKWSDFMSVEYVTLKIVPDSSARNNRTEDIVRAISNMFKIPLDRVIAEGWKIKGFKAQERVFFEIRFEKGTVCFYMTVPKQSKQLLEKRISSVWDKSSIIEVSTTLFNPNRSELFEMKYIRHDLLSIHTDAKDNLPLDSILDAGRLIQEGDKASVFTYFEPIHQASWQYHLTEAWEKLKGGVMPRNIGGSKRETFMAVFVGLNIIFKSVFSMFSEMINGESAYKNEVVDAEASKYALNNLSTSTRSKRSKAGIKTHIWTICESEDTERANLVARSLSQAFGDLAGDNEIVGTPVRDKVKKGQIVNTVNNYIPPKVKIRSMTMSTAEASKILQIAGDELQQKYKEVERIDQKQVELSCKELFDKRGLHVGYMTLKGHKYEIYQPVKNVERLCLPMVAIGGMGAGKTKGLISNRLIEAVLKGFGGVAIDPNKREISHQLKMAIKAGHIPEDKVEFIDLSKVIFGLDFIEATKDERSLSRLSNMFIYFFNVAEETTGQTERFLRAAVMSMTTGRVMEAIKILNNKEALAEAVKRLEAKYEADNINLTTLQEYASYSNERRRQIMSPIFNRIAEIMSDDYLDKSLRSTDSLDFVQLMAQKKAFVIDIPQDEFDKVVIDTLVNMIALKIDIAMRLREKHTGQTFPFFVLIDEPHQFSKSTKVWTEAVVESRKYRVPYTFAFHNWGQLPKGLQESIRSAICHYHLYKSHSDTFKGLKDEILPFELKDGINLAPHTAITIFETGDTKQKPFICHMLNSPENRFKSE